nr:MAG TPA: hypothetical protein [Caudoviricetes sp.]
MAREPPQVKGGDKKSQTQNEEYFYIIISHLFPKVNFLYFLLNKYY